MGPKERDECAESLTDHYTPEFLTKNATKHKIKLKQLGTDGNH